MPPVNTLACTFTSCSPHTVRNLFFIRLIIKTNHNYKCNFCTRFFHQCRSCTAIFHHSSLRHIPARSSSLLIDHSVDCIKYNRIKMKHYSADPKSLVFSLHKLGCAKFTYSIMIIGLCLFFSFMFFVIFIK